MQILCHAHFFTAGINVTVTPPMELSDWLYAVTFARLVVRRDVGRTFCCVARQTRQPAVNVKWKCLKLGKY